ncbi:MAG: CDP-glycerol glycerophosphotransferase family protein [Thermoplasmata archaeon]|nr:CDP-glycerol glycerophosphotransferase family protein [Thermoplasmata archaeon]
MSSDYVYKFKRLLYWYSREGSVLRLPILILSITIWIALSKLLRKFDVDSTNKEKSVIAFTSVYYNGNARAVFEKMEKQSKYKCYWVARNMITFRYMRRIRKNVVYAYFPFPHIRMIKSTDVLVTNDTYLTFLFQRERCKFIQLWHGVGPKGIAPDDYELCDARCVTSDFTKHRHLELWKAPLEKLYVTGFARMDRLYNLLKLPKEEIKRELAIESKGKVLLYAPTFDIGLWPWGDQYTGFEKLCRYCNRKGLVLVLRLHPFARLNKRRLKRLVGRYKNVYWIDMQKEPDTMKLLAVADILLTDWSSIYTDFFLTKRPIVYIEIHPEFFTKLRGKPEIPPEMRAGEIVKTPEELFGALDKILEKGNLHTKRQEEFLEIIHGTVDGKATDRVIMVIEKILHGD